MPTPNGKPLDAEAYRALQELPMPKRKPVAFCSCDRQDSHPAHVWQSAHGPLTCMGRQR